MLEVATLLDALAGTLTLIQCGRRGWRRGGAVETTIRRSTIAVTNERAGGVGLRDIRSTILRVLVAIISQPESC